MFYYHIDDVFSKAKDVNGDLDWLVMNYLCELTDNDKDWVVTVSLLIRQN